MTDTTPARPGEEKLVRASDPVRRFRGRITLAASVIVVVALILFFTNYGTWSVISGMDTMPEGFPPGATCIIKKSPGSVKKGSVVLIDVGDGAALLTRVERIEGDQIHIRHDNRQSRFVHLEKQSYPMSAVRALVLSALLSDDAGVPDGK